MLLQLLILAGGGGVLAAAQVTLIWDANPEPNISGYRLYYGESSGNYGQVIDVGDNITSTVSNLQDGITYFFAVTAYNTIGLESDFSQEVSYSGPQAAKLELVGSYNGLLYDTNGVQQQKSGFFTLTASGQGAFSAQLTLGGRRYSFSGQFDQGGKATNVITEVGQSPLTVKLQLVPRTNQTQVIVGSVGDGTWLAQLAGERASFNARTNPARYAGRYTLIIPGGNNPAASPSGDGCASILVNTAGKVRLKGMLADGTKITQKGLVSQNGQWPLYVPLYGGQGLIMGWVNFTNRPTDDLSGLLSWIKPALPTSELYSAGFSFETTALGSTFIPPASAANTVLNAAQGIVILSGGNLSAPLTNTVSVAANNAATYAGTNNLRLKISLSTGLLSGSVVEPVTGESIRFQGALLQRMDTISGYFLGTNQSGRVSFESGP